MISAVFWVVKVMKHGNCPLIRSKTELGGYFPPERLKAGAGTCDCSMWNKSSFQNVKYETGSSPGCGSVFEKSMDWRNSRGGVPVFKRPSSKPSSLSELERFIAAASPARPPDC